MSQSKKSVGAETDVHHGLLQGVWIADAANERARSRMKLNVQPEAKT